MKKLLSECFILLNEIIDNHEADSVQLDDNQYREIKQLLIKIKKQL